MDLCSSDPCCSRFNCCRQYTHTHTYICVYIGIWGFPGGASGKEPTCQFRRHKRCGFDPQVGKIPWRRAWQLQYSCLENPTDRGAWRDTDSPQGHKELDTMKRPSTYAQSILGCGFRIQTHNFFLHKLKQMPVYLNTYCCNLTSIY